MLEAQGADRFFGEPALTLADLLQVDFSGNGVISLLDATQLVQKSPRVYAALLMWLLSELFEELPEAGDRDTPKLVLFFDEAHLLFDGASKPLLDKIEQVVRLIRSKGVGVYFVTQSPLDVPDAILGQLGLKVQHALRTFTPKDRQMIRSVAQGFRAAPGVDVETAVTELGTGEALVSTLDAKGAPQPVARTLIAPPESRIGPLESDERAERIARSPLRGKYDANVDRESAYEMLKARAARETAAAAAQRRATTQTRPRRNRLRAPGRSPGEAMVTSAARAIGSSLGRQLIRGILGSLLKRSSDLTRGEVLLLSGKARETAAAAEPIGLASRSSRHCCARRPVPADAARNGHPARPPAVLARRVLGEAQARAAQSDGRVSGAVRSRARSARARHLRSRGRCVRRNRAAAYHLGGARAAPRVRTSRRRCDFCANRGAPQSW